MAPKKRKGRKATRQRAQETLHEPRVSQSGRPSIDGEGDIYPAASSSSMVGTEEEEEAAGNDTLTDLRGDSEDDNDNFEVASLYPASQIRPGAMSTYRSAGGHFMVGDSRTLTSDLASTRSLWTMDLDYRELYGRRYCRHYHMPNDEIEQLRLTLLNQVFLHIFDGELSLAPFEKNPSHILDVGTGTGEWAIRIAEMYPECEVVGTDISAIAETESVPVNVFFEIEDAEDWDRPPDHYDMIHMRWLTGAFRDWGFIYDCAYYSLKPGGWIEVLDFGGFDTVDYFKDHFPPESPVHNLFKNIHIAADKAGRKVSIAHLNAPNLMEAGFVDIRVVDYSLPVIFGEPSIDKIWLMVLIDGIESMALRLLTEYLNWDPDECKAICEQVARELAKLTKNPEAAKSLTNKLRVVVARKPLQAPRSNAAWPADEPLSLRPRIEEGTSELDSASNATPRQTTEHLVTETPHQALHVEPL